MKAIALNVPHYVSHFLRPNPKVLEYFLMLLIPKVIDSATDHSTVKSYWDQNVLFFTSLPERPRVSFWPSPILSTEQNTKMLWRSCIHDRCAVTNTEWHQERAKIPNFSKNASNSLYIHFLIVQSLADKAVSLPGQGPIGYQTLNIKHVEITGLGSSDLPLW